MLYGTTFHQQYQANYYKGKVRDVYSIGDKLVVVSTNRISAFDHVLHEPIPYKGQVLNQTAAHFLHATADVVPNWLLCTPHPNVSIGWRCQPYKIEMVVRGYLSGHAWRTYNQGIRTLCGVMLPEGLQENDRLPTPIITPTTKAPAGHDEDISRTEIIANGIVAEAEYTKLEEYALVLFARGTAMAAERGLILVDTKYEFGKKDEQIMLIDEIHTPDSSRYFLTEGYLLRQYRGEKQQQLSKEFVREWLIAHNFQGKDGQAMPHLPADFIKEISERYIQLYEKVTGNTFVKHDGSPQQIEAAIFASL